MAGIIGAHLDWTRWAFVEHFSGYSAPMGSSTVLPIILKDKPKTKDMMRVVVGTTGQGGHDQRRGTDWDVDLTTGLVTWLGRTALTSSQWISFFYMPYGHGKANAFAWM